MRLRYAVGVQQDFRCNRQRLLIMLLDTGIIFLVQLILVTVAILAFSKAGLFRGQAEGCKDIESCRGCQQDKEGAQQKFFPKITESAEQVEVYLLGFPQSLRCNVDNEKELASAFGIQSIPTLLFIPKTGKPQIAQGALSKEQFVEQIDNFLLKK